MKKVTAGVMAMILALTLAGCSDSGEDEESSNDEERAVGSEERMSDGPVQTLNRGGSNMRAPLADGWHHWVCANETTLEWRMTRDEGAVDLMFGKDDTVYRLHLDISDQGRRFTDGLLSFQLDGESGMLYWNGNKGLIGDGCISREELRQPESNM